MSQIQTRLDPSRSQIEEIDVFTRLLTGQIWDEEEVRYLRPTSYINTWAYVGVAKSGASPLDPVWSCIRRSYDGRGKIYRDQFRESIAWTDVESGWN
jgi:hypothetical protein